MRPPIYRHSFLEARRVTVGLSGIESDIPIVGEYEVIPVRRPIERTPWEALPNFISLTGYACTLGWLAGGGWGLAVAGILADELDGRVARATGTQSERGGLLDWAIDVTLTGMVLMKMGWSWLLLAVTPIQVYLRDDGYRPPVGSARAAFTVIALLKGI